MAYTFRSPKLAEIFEARDLGALNDGSNGPIGSQLELTYDALYDAQDTDVLDSEAERLNDALDALDACCDPDSGYFTDAPGAHRETNRIVGILADITERAIKQPRMGE